MEVKRPERPRALATVPRAVCRALPLVLGALAACTVQMSSDGYVTRETRRFAVSEAPEVRLVTFEGAVELRGTDTSEVSVEIEKRAATPEALEAVTLSIHADAQTVHLEARRPASARRLIPLGGAGGLRVDLAATLPRRVNVSARTGEGALKVERLAGRLDLRTGGGPVLGADLSGELLVDSGAGSIELRGVDGRLVASTATGRLSVDGRFEQLSLRTGDGSVQLRVEPGSVMAADWQIVTGDGAIVVYLPVAFAATIDAATGDGMVRVEDALPLEGVERERRSLRATLGRGGRRLSLRSGDGSIVVRAW